MAEQYGAALFGGDVMLTNADCTLYEKDTFARHIITDVYWNDSRGQTVTRNGAQISDSVIVYIYETDYLPKAGDIIVRDIIDFAFDTASQRSASESMKQFREAYPQFAAIKNVSDCRYGGLPHIEVIAR